MNYRPSFGAQFKWDKPHDGAPVEALK